jgi:dipeptidyl aminopeptidase/acylaminoacyl peptidase
LTRRVYGDGPMDKPLAFASRNALSSVPYLKTQVLILQAGLDYVVPPDQALRFKAALDQAGIPAILKFYPNSQHAFLVYGPSSTNGANSAEYLETEQAWQALLAFLEARLKLLAR